MAVSQIFSVTAKKVFLKTFNMRNNPCWSWSYVVFRGKSSTLNLNIMQLVALLFRNKMQLHHSCSASCTDNKLNVEMMDPVETYH